MRVCACALTLLLATVGQTPEQPDFSGRWVLVGPNPAPADVSRVLVVEQHVQPIDIRGNPVKPFFSSLVVKGDDVKNGIRSGAYRIGGIGGSVGGVPVGSDWTSSGPIPRSEHSVRWDGDKLVIASENWIERDVGKRESLEQHIEVWRLGERGELVITATDAKGGGETKTRELTYRKEHPQD